MNFDKQKIKFGKYKGKLASWVVDNDIQYAEWLAQFSNSNTLSKRAVKSFLDKTKINQLNIPDVVVPRNEGTLCDCRSQPYWKEPCEDCMEGYTERWQP